MMLRRLKWGSFHKNLIDAVASIPFPEMDELQQRIDAANLASLQEFCTGQTRPNSFFRLRRPPGRLRHFVVADASKLEQLLLIILIFLRDSKVRRIVRFRLSLCKLLRCAVLVQRAFRKFLARRSFMLFRAMRLWMGMYPQSSQPAYEGRYDIDLVMLCVAEQYREHRAVLRLRRSGEPSRGVVTVGSKASAASPGAASPEMEDAVCGLFGGFYACTDVGIAFASPDLNPDLVSELRRAVRLLVEVYTSKVQDAFKRCAIGIIRDCVSTRGASLVVPPAEDWSECPDAKLAPLKVALPMWLASDDATGLTRSTLEVWVPRWTLDLEQYTKCQSVRGECKRAATRAIIRSLQGGTDAASAALRDITKLLPRSQRLKTIQVVSPQRVVSSPMAGLRRSFVAFPSEPSTSHFVEQDEEGEVDGGRQEAREGEQHQRQEPPATRRRTMTSTFVTDDSVEQRKMVEKKRRQSQMLRSATLDSFIASQLSIPKFDHQDQGDIERVEEIDNAQRLELGPVIEPSRVDEAVKRQRNASIAERRAREAEEDARIRRRESSKHVVILQKLSERLFDNPDVAAINQLGVEEAPSRLTVVAYEQKQQQLEASARGFNQQRRPTLAAASLALQRRETVVSSAAAGPHSIAALQQLKTRRRPFKGGDVGAKSSIVEMIYARRAEAVSMAMEAPANDETPPQLEVSIIPRIKKLKSSSNGGGGARNDAPIPVRRLSQQATKITAGSLISAMKRVSAQRGMEQLRLQEATRHRLESRLRDSAADWLQSMGGVIARVHSSENDYNTKGRSVEPQRSVQPAAAMIQPRRRAAPRAVSAPLLREEERASQPTGDEQQLLLSRDFLRAYFDRPSTLLPITGPNRHV